MQIAFKDIGKDQIQSEIVRMLERFAPRTKRDKDELRARGLGEVFSNLRRKPVPSYDPVDGRLTKSFTQLYQLWLTGVRMSQAALGKLQGMLNNLVLKSPIFATNYGDQLKTLGMVQDLTSTTSSEGLTTTTSGSSLRGKSLSRDGSSAQVSSQVDDLGQIALAEDDPGTPDAPSGAGEEQPLNRIPRLRIFGGGKGVA